MKILIVEDQFVEANNLRMILKRAGHTVCTIAQSVARALTVLEAEQPDLVLLDIYLKGEETGIDLAYMLWERNIAYVYLSANSNIDVLEAAKATQPYGFLIKPFREKDVLVTLDIAMYLHENSLAARLRNEPGLREKVDAVETKNTPFPASQTSVKTTTLPGVVGRSEILQQVSNLVHIVAPGNTSVLIMGESGTGKEKIADAIHRFSPRHAEPFIKVNCATLQLSLVESELFGHEKGAFTGASDKRTGKFELANGGTIFLDEVGELELDVQAKLLRVLQEKEVEPIGGKAPIKVNVRVLAATNRNLAKEVAEGRFRIDLYYRLNVFPITLPPLRARKEDIPALVAHFVACYAQAFGKRITGVSPAVMQAFMKYEWPGNVRELANLVERGVLMATGTEINDSLLPPAYNRTDREAPANNERLLTLEENEREHITAALKKCKGKVSGKDGAAEVLGINVSTLNARIRKLGIQKVALRN